SDVYVNVVGGLSVEGTGQDLGLALSLISSAKAKLMKFDRILAIGEIGLTGEIRPVSHVDRLISEGAKMGFENFVIPKRSLEKVKIKNVNIIAVEDIREAIQKLF
ncbi:MAG: DNA repair protein RadA, partial [Clostridium sp.]|nr:DNA repair protein RadA [Clostridium sp.]